MQIKFITTDTHGVVGFLKKTSVFKFFFHVFFSHFCARISTNNELLIAKLKYCLTQNE